MAINWENCTVKLGDLRPWAENPRYSTKAQAKRILESFKRFGQVVAVAIGPNNEVYDGHQRLSALLTLHGPEHEIDARRSARALTDDERRSLTLALNGGAVGAWNWDALSGWDAALLQDEGFDADMLKDLNASASNLAEMLEAEQSSAMSDVEAPVDRAEEIRAKWGVKVGQVWMLGKHRIICGDCTDPSVVERVMAGDRAELVTTDPPYGVAVGDKNRFLNSIAPGNRVEKNLDNDTLDEGGLVQMLRRAFENAVAVCLPGASWYVAAPPGPLHLLFGQVLKDLGVWRQTIQWVKNNSTFSPMGVCYHWQCEPIFFGWLPNGAHRWHGGRKETTAWFIDRPQASPDHPTMKPIELVGRTIRNSTLPGEVVYEPFSGSGTTLLACEQLGRVCRAVEIDPGYVAVAIERWHLATGQAPELVNTEA